MKLTINSFGIRPFWIRNLRIVSSSSTLPDWDPAVRFLWFSNSFRVSSTYFSLILQKLVQCNYKLSKLLYVSQAFWNAYNRIPPGNLHLTSCTCILWFFDYLGYQLSFNIQLHRPLCVNNSYCNILVKFSVNMSAK